MGQRAAALVAILLVLAWAAGCDGVPDGAADAGADATRARDGSRGADGGVDDPFPVTDGGPGDCEALGHEQTGVVLEGDTDAASHRVTPLAPGEAFSCMLLEVEVVPRERLGTDCAAQALARIEGKGSDGAVLGHVSLTSPGGGCSLSDMRLALETFAGSATASAPLPAAERFTLRVYVRPFETTAELVPVGSSEGWAVSTTIEGASLRSSYEPHVTLGASGSQPATHASYESLRIRASAHPLDAGSTDAGTPGDAGPPPDTRCAPEAGTPSLAQRRLQALRYADSNITIDREHAEYPTPNYAVHPGRQTAHYFKALAILERVARGDAPASRSEEANRILRYALLGRWTVSEPGHVLEPNAIMTLNNRIVPVRIYASHRDRLDADVRTEIERRLRWMLVGPFNRSSENHRFSSNAPYFLAHELLGETSRDTYAQLESWLLDWLRRLNEQGPAEWGARYFIGMTVPAILGLTDLSTNEGVARMARATLDYAFATLGQLSVGYGAAPTGVRRYPGELFGMDPNTRILQVLFSREPSFDPGLWPWLTAAASSYRPLVVVDALYRCPRPGETRLRTRTWPLYHRAQRGDDYVLTALHNVERDYYGSPEVHDIASCLVQSSGGPRHRVTAYGSHPDNGRYRSRREMGFSYDNVAFHNSGGSLKKAWTSGTYENIPIRLFYSDAFEVEIDGGWAFLTDHTVYVAWAPTRGAPRRDSGEHPVPERDGRLLVSDYAPDIQGETAVMEVGDAASFGSYADFKSDVRARNPRPRWSGGTVTYAARDGTMLEFGMDVARVDGVEWDPRAHPRARGPGLDGPVVSAGDSMVRFDFATGSLSGDTARIR